ncbi:glycoside hydrolase family 16 protein [Gonapodya prolifera JEL478]|uniref:Glycoside hydrolase family 16 protein n=1 Tax=Gonapodya prolifera (strain JEL478) TaxID=1344416 RepID=A0A138ZXN2_GONPJ|nr:glycoside hydrolase family 16 protein [Gonapodya prolifera JEL478]|eukprot:KXS09262.1 glycoside hydrolase family 16 protein [Gonapodya prolifera JEL478]
MASNDDIVRLAKMGYRQEFKRGFTLIHNFGVSFSHISIIIGVGTLLSYTLLCGGPAGAIIGWFVVSFLSLMVALSMGEICSAYPTAGGLYYWCAKLGGEKWGPISAWYTGWFNLSGEIGGLASGGFAVSGMMWSVVLLWNPDTEVSLAKLTATAECVLVFCGLMNSITDEVIAHVTEFSVFIHLAGTVFIIAVLLAKAPVLQSSSFVFTQFENQTGQDSMGFAVLLGFLFPAWTYLGYDASAHVSEETHNSHTEAAKGVILSVVISIIAGFVLLLGCLYSIQDVDAVLSSPFPQQIMQIFVDAAGQNWATALMVIVMAASVCCIICAVTANSRMMYAFARDAGFGHAVSKFFYWSHPTTKLPLRTVWLGTGVAMILTLAGFGSNVALSAFASIGTIGLMTAYIIPTIIKAFVAKDTFKPGPIHLGPFSLIVNYIAIAWVCFLFVLLCLPSFYPVTALNLNYASIMISFIVTFTTLYWFLSAKKWFKGPITHVTEEEIAALEAEAERLNPAPFHSPLHSLALASAAMHVPLSRSLSPSGAALAALAAACAAAATLPALVSSNALPSIEKFGRGQPACRSVRDDFDNAWTMATVDAATWDTTWVNEEWPYEHAVIENGHLVLRMNLLNNYTNPSGKNEGTGATVSFNPFFDTGKVCFSMKASPGKGVVSAFIVSSFTPNQPVDDNLLWEWVATAQTNYYAYGKDTPRAQVVSGLKDYASQYHTYCVERCTDFVAWSVDGKEVRRITPTSVGGVANFPNRGGKSAFNIWDDTYFQCCPGHGRRGPGYTTWASGPTSWSGNPTYEMYVDWAEVSCGCASDPKPPPPPPPPPTARSCDTIHAAYAAGTKLTAQDYSDWNTWKCSTWFPGGIGSPSTPPPPPPPPPATTRSCDSIHTAYAAGTTLTAQDYSDWASWKCSTWYPGGIGAAPPPATRSCDSIYNAVKGGATKTQQDVSDWDAWKCSLYYPGGI